MNGSGRLSLRARLLVVLIAVTAAFLLVMGGVTAIVLSKRLGTQFDDGLISAAARTPAQIQSNPGGYVAVEITRFPVTVQPLTGSTGTTSELASAVERIVASGNFRGYIKDTPFAVPATAPRLRAVARPVRAAAGARPGGGRRFLAVLIVARPVGVVTGQVGGIVVAELITGGALILLLALGGRWTRTRAPRSAGSARPSIPCWTGSSRRSVPGCAPSTRCGSSPRTPRMSCAPRSPPSAVTPSCTARGRWGPASFPMPCAASRKRPGGWARSLPNCWSWPGWIAPPRST